LSCSFYRYLSQAYEHDRQLLAEQDKDKLALELSILHDRLTSAYRRLTLIASNENIAAKDRIDAEAASCEVALAIAKLAFEGPIVLKGFSRDIKADPSGSESLAKISACGGIASYGTLVSNEVEALEYICLPAPL
jgi:hypothetical protein